MTLTPRRPIPRVPAKRLAASGPQYSTITTQGKKRKKAWKRTPSEYARIYGSRARVAWFKKQPCLYCILVCPILRFVEDWKCHNAHTVTGGVGRKADADTIVPLCPVHHSRYDQHRAPLDDPKVREIIQNAAPKYAAAWLTYSGDES